MTSTTIRPASLTPERLDQIRESLARLGYPDVAYAAPYTWAAMLRDTIAEIDRLTAELGSDRPAYRLAVADITCGHYAPRDEARLHALAAANEAGLPVKSPHWVPDSGDEDSAEDLCRVDGFGDSVTTGYRITPITVRAKYDPNAEW